MKKLLKRGGSENRVFQHTTLSQSYAIRNRRILHLSEGLKDIRQITSQLGKNLRECPESYVVVSEKALQTVSGRWFASKATCGRRTLIIVP